MKIEIAETAVEMESRLNGASSVKFKEATRQEDKEATRREDEGARRT